MQYAWVLSNAVIKHGCLNFKKQANFDGHPAKNPVESGKTVELVDPV